jgi:hypothetical protein
VLLLLLVYSLVLFVPICDFAGDFLFFLFFSAPNGAHVHFDAPARSFFFRGRTLLC